MIQDVRSAKGFRRKWFFIFGSPVKIMQEKERAKAQAMQPVMEDSIA
jgi:hypothetical protein